VLRACHRAIAPAEEDDVSMGIVRPSLAGAMFLGLVLAGGNVVAAQPASPWPPFGPVPFAGTFEPGIDGCPDDALNGLGKVDTGPARWVDCLHADDARISGRVVRDAQEVVWDTPPFSWWGTSVRIENRAGDWVGSGQGFRTSTDRTLDWMTLRGTASYEGLTALVMVDGDRVEGVIAPAEPPDAPGPVDPSKPYIR
jgi:hypothetical protein